MNDNPFQSVHLMRVVFVSTLWLITCTFYYSFNYNCSVCEYTELSEYENVLPTLPELVNDFNIQFPVHKKKCPVCANTEDGRKMVFEK